MYHGATKWSYISLFIQYIDVLSMFESRNKTISRIWYIQFRSIHVYIEWYDSSIRWQSFNSDDYERLESNWMNEW